MTAEINNTNRLAIEIFTILFNEATNHDEAMCVCATVAFSINMNHPKPETPCALASHFHEFFHKMHDHICNDADVRILGIKREPRQ